ncbi:hypothetical protein P691DRAFT_790115 [Macrolepiota fuliginosa MF-IS2]|uniref:Uncharacterized protein n=1 Tax=Macrolepiota fuliginosa MF-IS2 TaxID=1400762 RepID=A0A9P5X0L7_9AGAR|nr:hypothetical protein P691DRAFT_790115 [Macrolepiota fuliginosa MF-IS2]
MAKTNSTLSITLPNTNRIILGYISYLLDYWRSLFLSQGLIEINKKGPTILEPYKSDNMELTYGNTQYPLIKELGHFGGVGDALWKQLLEEYFSSFSQMLTSSLSKADSGIAAHNDVRNMLLWNLGWYLMDHGAVHYASPFPLAISKILQSVAILFTYFLNVLSEDSRVQAQTRWIYPNQIRLLDMDVIMAPTVNMKDFVSVCTEALAKTKHHWALQDYLHKGQKLKAFVAKPNTMLLDDKIQHLLD